MGQVVKLSEPTKTSSIFKLHSVLAQIDISPDNERHKSPATQFNSGRSKSHLLTLEPTNNDHHPVRCFSASYTFAKGARLLDFNELCVKVCTRTFLKIVYNVLRFTETNKIPGRTDRVSHPID
jgi:hypothetical protein